MLSLHLILFDLNAHRQAGSGLQKSINAKACEGRAKQAPYLLLSLVGSPKPTDPGEGLKKVALGKFFNISGKCQGSLANLTIET